MAHALINVDMQNGFLHPEGSFMRSGGSLLNREIAIKENARLLAAARRRGWSIVHTVHEHRRGYVDAPPVMKEMFGPFEGLVAGTWDAATLDEVAPLPDELIVRKCRYDAFLYTDLEVLLRAVGARTLIIAGIITHGCVEATARSADARDFRVTVAEDAVTSLPEFHEPSLRAMAGIGIAVCPWREAVDMEGDHIDDRTPSTAVIGKLPS